MIDSNDTERTINPATGLIQVGWPSGTLTLRYVGIPTVSNQAMDDIKDTMQHFSADCQMMLVWFAGILGSQKAMQQHFDEVAERDEPFSINSYRPDGRVDSVLAQIPVEKVKDAVSDAGEFERLYAKAFVVFTYQIWEEVTRPKMAAALGLEDAKHVTAELMGEWRHLRNWLIHQTESAEHNFFEKARMLPRLLGMQRNEPNLTADVVFTLMRHLNQMQVDVNPESLEFGLKLAKLDPGMIAGAAKTMEPGTQTVIPMEAAMYPSSAYIIFNDGPTATIHESGCSHTNSQFQNTDGARCVRVSSSKFAVAVVKQLGKIEHRCEHCRPSEEQANR